MQELGNLSIMGDSAINGGTYKKVSVMGTLTLNDTVTAREVSVMGTLDSRSDIACDSISVMGTAKIQKLTVGRTASVMGQLTARDIVAEAFDVKGEVRCENNFECGELEVRGAVQVGALLSAERLWIKSGHVSSAKEIGGKRITVRAPLLFSGTALRAEVIEFDEVDIDCVEAQVVRGNNVTIGRDCRIDTVEYAGVLTRHPSAQIGKAIRMGDPQN